MRRAAVYLVLAGALLACGETFQPSTVVDGFRVLGIRAQPAEVKPGETTEVSALVVDPSDPTRRNTMLWIACDPDPFDLGRSACSELSQFADPSSLVQSTDGGTPSFPPGMNVIGFGERAFYTPSPDLFSQLDAGDPRRTSGTLAQVLLLAVAEEVSPAAPREELDALLERVRTGEVPSITAIFRIRVSDAPTPNQNPEIGPLFVDGRPIPEGAHVTFRPTDQMLMRFTAPEASMEKFSVLLPEGVVEERTERFIASPYTTGGRFNLTRLAVNEPVETVFTAPGGRDDDPVPEPGRGRLWFVYRDTRGGQAWREHRLHACEALGAPPEVVEVRTAPLDQGTRVTFEGKQLDRILDGFIGERALRDAAFSKVTGHFTGTLPEPLPAGTYEVRVRARDCVEYDTGHRLAAP